MARIRVRRIAEQMKKEVANIIETELKDPRIGFVTVISVDLSNDLRHAKIFVSILGDEQKKQESLEGLHRATGFVRSEIARRIKLRYTPEIQFVLDTSIEHGVKIAKLLSKVNEEDSSS